MYLFSVHVTATPDEPSRIPSKRRRLSIGPEQEPQEPASSVCSRRQQREDDELLFRRTFGISDGVGLQFEYSDEDSLAVVGDNLTDAFIFPSSENS